MKSKQISKKIFLTTGNVAYIAKKLLAEKKFCNYSVYSLPLWGMKYKKVQLNQISKWDKIIVLEDHLEDGGFGSWIKESTNDYKIKTHIISKSLSNKVIGKVGSEKYLLENNYLKFIRK